MTQTVTRKISGVVALGSLAVCLVAPALYFWGRIDAEPMKLVFLVASAGWFVSASVFRRAWA